MTRWIALFRAYCAVDTADSADTSPLAEMAGYLGIGSSVSSVKAPEWETTHHRAPDPLCAATLRACYRAQAVLVRQDGQDSPAAATGRAWNAVAAIWYRQHGTRTPTHLCAGCGKPLDGEADVLLLPHGERAHIGDGYSCIRAYGRRWKGEAAAALAAIGVPTPPLVMTEISEALRESSDE